MPDDHSLLKTRIEEWLEDEGISFSDVPDMNSYFHVRANLKNVPIDISESKVRKGVLAVQGALDLSADQLDKYQLASKEDKKSLFRALFEMLDRSEYLFLLQEDFEVQSWLKIQRAAYIEDLNRTKLLGEMKDLNMRFVNVNYIVNESLARFASDGMEE